MAGAGCYCQSDTRQHLLQRSAYQAWQRSAGSTRITVGQEMVGIVEEVGKAVTKGKTGRPGDSKRGDLLR